MMAAELIANETSIASKKAALVKDVKVVLGDARNSLHDAGVEAVEKARGAARATGAYVKTNPWKVLGVAAAAGLIAGFLSTRR